VFVGDIPSNKPANDRKMTPEMAPEMTPEMRPEKPAEMSAEIPPDPQADMPPNAPAATHQQHARAKARAIANICVYCGSNVGANPAYTTAARSLGAAMAKAGTGLVYGGGSLGLMGEVARSVLQHGGRVTGIIPAFLSEKERMLRDADELIIVEDMHQRKRLMFDRSDAFVALPGGIGTLEELVEQLTWAQLGRHNKPIVLLNVDGFWAPLLDLLGHMREEAFIRREMEVRYLTVAQAEDVVPAIMAAADAPLEPAGGLSDRF
jgi:uncharacterized protein (TIGR00730 family)